MSNIGSTVRDFSDWMENIAPLALSESWDNTGLLLGDPNAPVRRVQTCLTLTPASTSEAVSCKANLVIVHHPLPFKPLKKITTETTTGQILWELAGSRIAVYAPHTAWDSAPSGINALLASKLELSACQPIVPTEKVAESSCDGVLGAGIIGTMCNELSLAALTDRLSATVPGCRPRAVDSGKPIRRVAIACGSGGSLLTAALKKGCDLFLTGESTFHHCLEAEAAGCSLLMIGHFASERFAMDHLAKKISVDFPEVDVWASQNERDPISQLTETQDS